jgi:amidase
MVTLEKNNKIYGMSALNPPVLEIEQDTEVCFKTHDCYEGQLLREGSSFRQIRRELENPATGPVFVNGALPGDMLKIEIVAIDPGETGILDAGKTSGPLKTFFPEKENEIRRVKISDGFIHFDDCRIIPVSPMIGVIGNAPENGTVPNISPGDHGGNLDCTEIKAGNTLYLPVFHTGGLLSVGDVHALMGDGECGNCGVETGAKVILKIGIGGPDMKFRFPVIESENSWMVLASSESLDQAADLCAQRMLLFLNEKFGLSRENSAYLIDMLGNLKVCQIVNPLKTIRMEIGKSFIDPHTAV